MKTKRTKEQFIEEANRKHGDNFYEYKIEAEVYLERTDKVTIICPVHGEFKQLVYAHLRGNRCKQCANEGQRIKMTKHEALDKIGLERQEMFEYLNLGDIVYLQSDLEIKCKKHGTIFVSKFVSHISTKHGCPTCIKEHLSDNRLPSKEAFIAKAKRVHGDKYDYSLVEHYVGNKTKVKVICPTHGEFLTRPDNHTNRGAGCRRCALENRKPVFISSQEIKLQNWLTENGILFEASNRKILSGYELDIFLPDYNMAIEVNGIYWHSIERACKPEFHNLKLELCEEKGIRLLQFYDVEVDEMFDFITGIIKNTINGVLCPDNVLNRRFYSVLDYPGYVKSEAEIETIDRFNIWAPGFLTK